MLSDFFRLFVGLLLFSFSAKWLFTLWKEKLSLLRYSFLLFLIG